MNPIDLLPRNLPRPADASALRDPTTGAEAGEGNGLSQGADNFGSLLEGLSEQLQNEGGKASSPETSEGLPSPDGNVPPPEAGLDVAGSVFSLLESFLPRALPQSGSAPSGSREQPSGSSPMLTPQEAQMSLDGGDIGKTTLPPRMLVSVQHQETHFSPVFEGSDTMLSAEAGQEAGIELELPASGESVDQPANVAHSGNQHRLSEIPGKNPALSLPMAQPPVEEGVAFQEQVEAQGVEKGEALKPVATEAGQAEPQSLPPATLHRLANAVGAEIRSMAAAASQPSSPSGGATRTISIKASESALRVLNLQLHPAELGAVTVKMRLAGDALEMELHVEREETAQMLRHDTEKLSALLRGSGYRPDVVSIQVADAANPDRAAPKMQTDMQFQGQSFAQGGASQDERSRNREKSYASTGAEQRRNAGDDYASGGSNRAGVYL